MCAVHSYRCRRKQVSCAACGLPYALGFRCFWVSPDCAIFWYISQKGLKTGQKQPKIAVFRGDNPLRIAYLTATRPLVRNLRNMARIFGDFRILLYLCTINTGNGSCFERRSVSRYDGFQCSFLSLTHFVDTSIMLLQHTLTFLQKYLAISELLLIFAASAKEMTAC